jgi:hypothetical protein
MTQLPGKPSFAHAGWHDAGWDSQSIKLKNTQRMQEATDRWFESRRARHLRLGDSGLV